MHKVELLVLLEFIGCGCSVFLMVVHILIIKIQHLDRHIVGRLCRAFRIDLYRLQVAVEG